jgi:hypothetical protein
MLEFDTQIGNALNLGHQLFRHRKLKTTNI